MQQKVNSREQHNLDKIKISILERVKRIWKAVQVQAVTANLTMMITNPMETQITTIYFRNTTRLRKEIERRNGC